MSVKKKGREPHVNGPEDGFHESWCRHKNDMWNILVEVLSAWISGMIGPGGCVLVGWLNWMKCLSAPRGGLLCRGKFIRS